MKTKNKKLPLFISGALILLVGGILLIYNNISFFFPKPENKLLKINIKDNLLPLPMIIKFEDVFEIQRKKQKLSTEYDSIDLIDQFTFQFE